MSYWAAFPSTVPWQTNSDPNKNFTLYLIEEKMIRDRREKQLTYSEIYEIVVNDLHCASEVAYPLPKLSGRQLKQTMKKEIPFLSLYIILSAR